MCLLGKRSAPVKVAVLVWRNFTMVDGVHFGPLDSSKRNTDFGAGGSFSD